jgi:hypothetical protein
VITNAVKIQLKTILQTCRQHDSTLLNITYHKVVRHCAVDNLFFPPNRSLIRLYFCQQRSPEANSAGQRRTFSFGQQTQFYKFPKKIKCASRSLNYIKKSWSYETSKSGKFLSMKQQFMAVFVHGRWSFRVFFLSPLPLSATLSPDRSANPPSLQAHPQATRINTGLLPFPTIPRRLEDWAYLPGVVQTRFKMEG